MGFNTFTPYNDYKQSKRDARASVYSANAYAENMRNQATSLLNESVQNQHQQRKEARSILSGQRAQLGASGVASSSGSAIVTEKDLASQLEFNIQANARQAMQESKQLEFNADMTQWQGRVQRRQLKTQGTNSLLRIGYNTFEDKNNFGYTYLWGDNQKDPNNTSNNQG